MIESHWTRKQTAEYLTEHGIEGAASEAILKETAKVRHADRVRRTVGAAIADCSRADHIDGAPCHECLVRLLADRIGIGGHQGCSGDATARHPAFGHLGTGRKQAGDGAAWAAALDEAIWQATRDCSDVDVGPEDVWVAVGGEPLWARSFAREGLRRAVGLDPWHELPGVSLTGPAAEWAAIVNRAEDAILATTDDQVISDHFRQAFYAHPAHETDPALAECSAKETASELVPAGVTGTWDAEALKFVRDSAWA